MRGLFLLYKQPCFLFRHSKIYIHSTLLINKYQIHHNTVLGEDCCPVLVLPVASECDAMSSPVVWPVTSTKPTKSSCTVMVSRWRYVRISLHLYLHVPCSIEQLVLVVPSRAVLNLICNHTTSPSPPNADYYFK